MKSKHSKELIERVHKLLAHNPEACRFVLQYGELTEIADDLVDESTNPELVCRYSALACLIYSSNYWNKNSHALFMVELLNNLTYFDTTKWEKSDIAWMREHARVLNHCAYNMLFAVLILECGIEATRAISSDFRMSAHLHHIHDIV